MIKFCTDQKQMIALIKEYSNSHVNFYLFRNLNLDIKYKGMVVKYIFYIIPRNEKKIIIKELR